MEDGTVTEVYGVGSNWLNNDAVEMSQWDFIKGICGKSLPFPIDLKEQPD